MKVCPRTGKHCHETRRDAKRGIRHAGYPVTANAFLCEHCGCWRWGKRLRSATRKPRVVEPAADEFTDE